MTVRVTLDIQGSTLAEDKDYARELRISTVLPALARGERLLLDFGSVPYATQSFIHALLGEALKRHGDRALELLEFKNCSDQLRDIIELVVDYSLGGFENDGTV